MKKSKRKNPLKWLITNWFIALVQLIASVLVSYSILKLNVLSRKYLIAFFAVLLVGNLIYFALLFNRRKGARSTGKVLSVLISLAMFFGSFQMITTSNTVGKVTGGDEDSHVISVLVLKDDPAKNLSDLKGASYSYNKYVDEEFTSLAFEEIGKKNSETVNKNEVKNNDDLIAALYDGDTRAILLSEGQRTLLEEIHPGLSDDTRIIYQSIHTVKVDINQNKPPVDVLKDTYTIFISGIDTYGPVSTVARSDVNMLMTVDPQTNQILLTSIPRDYYVTLGRIGEKDKLTHAGVYGVEESVVTLEKLFDINIDYFVKVNFTSLTQIVDALGGITVDSQFAFTTGVGQQINVGPNNLNGQQTLAFVRERYNLPGGDNHRILNQQAAMKGIINKALSPAILLNYNSFLSAIDGSFVMSMPEADFTRIIRNQVDTMESWEILDQAVVGEGASLTTYSYPTRPLYVSIPDIETVQKAHDKIQAMEEHKRITQD